MDAATFHVQVTGSDCVEVVTPRLRAKFVGAALVRLEDARGRVLVDRDPSAAPAGIEVLFHDEKPIPLGLRDAPVIRAVQVSPRLAHVHIEDAQADALLRISVDDGGRLCVQLSADSLRYGIAAVQWVIAGIDPSTRLVAPVYQGLRQELGHPLVHAHYWAWPGKWEAAIAVLQRSGDAGGWSVECRDLAGRPKGLGVGHTDDPRTLRFRAENTGPWSRCTSVSSEPWIIDVHDGDWTVPAKRYRQWLCDACDLSRKARLRPDWTNEIRLTLQWCRAGDVGVLESLARLINPRLVLVHLSQDWRSSPYDRNYPDFTPSASGITYAAAAQAHGFRVLPHCNYLALDPAYPGAARFAPYLVRHPASLRLLGWRWSGAGSSGSFPQALTRLQQPRDTSIPGDAPGAQNLMHYVHPGFAPWRARLVEEIAKALRTMQVPGVFLDQTLCTWNTDNGLVDNRDMVQGMVDTMRELLDLTGPPVLAGEGRNEMSAQYHAFAQAHLYESHGKTNCEHFEQLDPVPFGQLLYGDLCQAMGYTQLSGRTAVSESRFAVNERLGILPSLTLQSREDVENMNPAARRVLELATSSR